MSDPESEVAPSHLFPAGSTISRKDFPDGFIFGTGSSAFQYEGAPDKDGKGKSIWDVFMRKHRSEIVKEGGLEAIDHYHRYEDDIKVMKEMGWDSYRFSISWTRILPKGRRTKGGDKYAGVNKKGVDFYDKLINKLLENDIKPIVTLFHWDSPQALEDEYGGFLSDKIVDDFRDYADLCFDKFGNRVEQWTTFNEPWSFAIGGYVLGNFAPGRGASKNMRKESNDMRGFFPGAPAAARNPWLSAPTEGDPRTEPYIVAHNQLLAHAAAVDCYRKTYQGDQGGRIGITLVTNWFVPYSTKVDVPHPTKDEVAAQRVLDFMFGWFMDPIYTGDYPDSMKKYVGDKRLPKFTAKEKGYLKGSYDYLGVNYYTSRYVRDKPDSSSDAKAEITHDRNGVDIGEKAGADWLYVYPVGIYEILKYIKDKYGNPEVYITENGTAELNKKDQSLWVSLFDHKRIAYHSSHLKYIKNAIEYGANVRGYYVWSLMDNLEWGSGFETRFGINFIDFKANVQRYPKLSAAWFMLLLKMDDEDGEDDEEEE